MLYNLLILLCIAAYLIAAGIQTLFLTAKFSGKQTLVFYLGLFAICGHGWLLYNWIDTHMGQNLTIYNLFSQAAWLVAVIQIVLAIRKPLENLAIFIFPICAVSIVLVKIFPNQNLVDAAANPLAVGHLILAIVAFSVLCIAGCQALLMAIQNWQLRHKDTEHALKILPPVESMEKLLFQLISIGFVLLSLLLISSIYFFSNVLTPPLLSKTLLGLLAWLIFAVLLMGRHLFGWQSRIVVSWTLGGVTLLLICYIVSERINF